MYELENLADTLIKGPPGHDAKGVDVKGDDWSLVFMFGRCREPSNSHVLPALC